MYAVMSFSMHYKDRLLCYVSVILGFVFVLTLAKLAFDSVAQQGSDSLRDPSWLVFLAAASFLAWVSGVAVGDLNYFYNMQPFYDVNTLNSYVSVDPSKMPGQQVMDAGRITFAQGSRLDTTKAMAFKNLDVYCVAPIVSGNSSGTTSSYDFWAVGLNCCSGAPGDFSCGEYSNPLAASGLRVMREDQRSFYRLAVQQAEAAYGIKARHPLFLYWMQDPIAEIAAYQDEGYKYYLFGVFTYFAFMLFLVLSAIVLFSKMSFN